MISVSSRTDTTNEGNDMFKLRSRILIGATALALTTVAPTAVLTSAAGASSSSCYLYADTPTWESYSVLAGEGGRLGCSTTRTVTVLLRQDRPWWPAATAVATRT